ncbi:MAG TPA: dTMP kinase [Thermoanaerobaculia bacterium]|nr:dTMP kinase [Thermoanaerobaculia bacterium]
MSRFITFEGLDGSGKSTHLRRVATQLAARGIPHLVTHEPGGTPLGEALRGLLKGERYGVCDGFVELLLVFASRRQHLRTVIEPALARGETVLCDRFTDSTFAYQGAGRGVPNESIAALDELATGGRRPDRTLLFDLPPEAARERGAARRRRRGERLDRFDAERLAFYERVRAGFLALARTEPQRFRVLDASGPVGATAALVEAALADLWPGGGE